MKIQRADEIADFAGCLGDIDDIFFTSSARHAFSSQEERQAFRDMSLGRYIEKHRSSFFVALNDAGGAVGYLAGCLENPLTNTGLEQTPVDNSVRLPIFAFRVA